MFYQASPHYIGVFGMTYDQFWREDPWIAKEYRRAWEEKRKSENYRDWLQGAYFFNAVSIALGNAFRKQGTKAENYLEEPFRIFPPTKEEMERENAKEQEKIEAVYRSIMKKQQADKAAKAAKEQTQDNAEA